MEASDAAAGLRRRLGHDLPVLDELSAQECAQVLECYERARADQKVELEHSLAQVLDKLPRLVRGPARKILFG